MWLFAVDVGGGLSTADANAIRRFSARGGGLLFTRDHHDLGACLLRLGEIGQAHFFNSANREPESWRHCVDDITFYENPKDTHPVGRKVSRTESAKLLVFFVTDRKVPLVLPPQR